MKRCLLLLAICHSTAIAQRDTSAAPLNTVVVTAERTHSVLSSSTSGVSRISMADLARTPRATIADALRRIPGFAVVDFDGLGFDPQVMVRGFYGGGEAEYIVMLVDGHPVAQLQNGTIPWAALPPVSAIEAIEVVRGSSAALYGDAAIGGVVNIITRSSPEGSRLRFEAGGSSFDGRRINASFVTYRDASIWAGSEHTDGYRDNAERSASRAGGIIPILRGDTKLSLSLGAHHQAYDEPGALLQSLLATDRRASDALFRFDHTKDRRYDIGLNGARGYLSGYIGGEMRKTEAVRTLALSPGFGDTKERETDNTRISASLQFGRNGLTVGADLAHSTHDSKYFTVVTGERSDYVAASGQRGEEVVASDGSRTNFALFIQHIFEPFARVKLSVGTRFDWIEDQFESSPPGDIEDAVPLHTAVSPKLGVSVRYADGARSSGNLYLTASTSFKAATLDQLFDQRPIPVPFPPFAVTTSNSLLDPQRGANVEVGAYHTITFSPFVVGSLSLSAYQMDMRGEIDFFVETLRYINIGRSRHRGLEAGLSVSHLGRGTVFANYALQNATIRIGPNSGNRLKAIPKHTATVGLNLSPTRALEVGASASLSSGAFIDDANAIPLEGFTRVDARASYAVRGVRVFVEARNLLDKKFNSTGFVDPAGTGELYFYPAAGRVISAGISSR